jgi:hypothetical protein
MEITRILSYHFQRPELYIRVLNVFIFTKEHQLVEQLSTSSPTNTDKTLFMQFLTQYHGLCKDEYDMSISTMEVNSSKVYFIRDSYNAVEKHYSCRRIQQPIPA